MIFVSPAIDVVPPSVSYSIHHSTLDSSTHHSIDIAQLTPEQCNLTALENAEPIAALFNGQPIQIVNDTTDRSVDRRLGYYFTLDQHLRRALEEAFSTGILSSLAIEIVSQQELYQVQAAAQNIFDGTTRQATVRLAAEYVIGDYGSPCALSLAAIENEFSEIILRARYYAMYGRALQPSVFQESATLALSSLASLVLQQELFQSAAEVRVFLQDTSASFQRRYAQNDNLPLSSPDQDAAFIAAWLNERLNNLLPTPFTDGQVQFTVDRSAGMGNVIKPIVVDERS